MNKAELIDEIAGKAGLSKKDSKAALDACLEAISGALRNGDKIQLIGFGTFAVVDKPARTGINPLTKDKIEIPARKAVKFKAASNMLG